MELNRNKLIFFIITGVIVFLLLVMLVIGAGGNGKKKGGSNKQTTGDIVIWTVFPEMEDVSGLVTDFKKKNPQYASKNIKIENFSDYETYSYALESSFASGTGPDVFVLNNNETSVFSDMTSGISPNVISVGDFRKHYKTSITSDLILKLEKGKEFLLGVPVGYETLGIFYNKRYIKSSDVQSISSMNLRISKIKERNRSSAPLGIGNGTTVKYAPDIATQFMLLEDDGGKSLASLSSSQMKTGLLAYLNYGYKNGGNDYNSQYQKLKDKDKNATSLFVNSDSFMIIGYPRLVNHIEKAGGIPVNFLFVSPFPHYAPGKGKTLMNYNYFVLNKNSKNLKFGETFLSYLFSEAGQKNFLKLYPFYLPARLSLESEMDSTKIHKKYNVKIGDFYSDDFELTSFDKGIKNVYDREMKTILDMGDSYEKSFTNFQSKLTCMTNKALKFTNIGTPCE